MDLIRCFLLARYGRNHLFYEESLTDFVWLGWLLVTISSLWGWGRERGRYFLPWTLIFMFVRFSCLTISVFSIVVFDIFIFGDSFLLRSMRESCNTNQIHVSSFFPYMKVLVFWRTNLVTSQTLGQYWLCTNRKITRSSKDAKSTICVAYLKTMLSTQYFGTSFQRDSLWFQTQLVVSSYFFAGEPSILFIVRFMF